MLYSQYVLMPNLSPPSQIEEGCTLTSSLSTIGWNLEATQSLTGEIEQRVDKLALLVGGNLLRAEGFFGRPRQTFSSGKTGMVLVLMSSSVCLMNT